MTDFQQLINDIQDRSRKHTLEWIAKEATRLLQKNGNKDAVAKTSTIAAIKNIPDRQPKYELGKALIELDRRTRRRRR